MSLEEWSLASKLYLSVDTQVGGDCILLSWGNVLSGPGKPELGLVNLVPLTITAPA